MRRLASKPESEIYHQRVFVSSKSFANMGLRSSGRAAVEGKAFYCRRLERIGTGLAKTAGFDTLFAVADLSENSPPQRVLLIKPSALGDVVTALPVLRGLRRSFGRQVRIDWMLSTSCAALVAHDDELDAVVPFERRRLGQGWRNPLAALQLVSLCRSLRKARYDWVIDMQGLFRSGWLSRVTGAPVRAGFASAREGAWLFYNRRLPAADEPAHTVDRNIALARMLGVDARPGDFRLQVRADAAAWANDLAGSLGGRYVVVAPATRWASKNYPTRMWRQVVKRLAEGVPVVLSAGPDEKHFTEPLRVGEAVRDLAGQTSLPQLAALIDRAAGVVCCDSAAMNIAAALDTPQVTLIGPTDPARTGPYRRDEGMLQSSLPCRACLRRACPHQTCMQTLDPGDVIRAVERVLHL